MSEKISIQEVQKLSSPEVASNVVKLRRVNFALKENRGVVKGGWEDDGILEYIIAKTTEDEAAWLHHPRYEDVVIYEMKPSITMIRLLMRRSR